MNTSKVQDCVIILISEMTAIISKIFIGILEITAVFESSLLYTSGVIVLAIEFFFCLQRYGCQKYSRKTC